MKMFNNLNLPHVDLFTRMQIEANAKSITSELKDADLAYAFGVTEETSQLSSLTCSRRLRAR